MRDSSASSFFFPRFWQKEGWGEPYHFRSVVVHFRRWKTKRSAENNLSHAEATEVTEIQILCGLCGLCGLCVTFIF